MQIDGAYLMPQTSSTNTGSESAQVIKENSSFQAQLEEASRKLNGNTTIKTMTPEEVAQRNDDIKKASVQLEAIMLKMLYNEMWKTVPKDELFGDDNAMDIYRDMYNEELTKKAADDLGLAPGIPVFGGGGDTTFVNIGAGCTTPGDTHIYVGTSGWVSTCLDYQTVDINAMITGVLSAKHGYFNYYAELETAGKCFEWVMSHLALDEVGVYLDQTKVTDVENKYHSLYNLGI